MIPNAMQALVMPDHPADYVRVERPRLWWILPDVNRTGVPLICQFRPEHTDKFTPERQQFVFSQNRSDDEARDRMAFQGYRDTFNTRGKVRDNWNDITQDGNPASLPTLEFNIGFRANVVTGYPIISDGSMGYPSGTPLLRLETIDVNKPLPWGINWRSHPWLIHHEVITLHEIRNPFPQMGGRDRAPYRPCFTPLWSSRPMYIRMSELWEVPSNQKIPNPYFPEWRFDV